MRRHMGRSGLSGLVGRVPTRKTLTSTKSTGTACFVCKFRDDSTVTTLHFTNWKITDLLDHIMLEGTQKLDVIRQQLSLPPCPIVRILSLFNLT